MQMSRSLERILERHHKRILERHPHLLFGGDVDHMHAHRGEASRGGEVGRRCEEGDEPAGAPPRGLLLQARSRR
jgi:hypothetical protein